MVILLDDALGQRQTETPAALLCGEAGFENVGNVFLADALAGVAHLNDYALGLFLHPQGNASLTAHGVDGVFAEVLDNPLEERRVDGDNDVLTGEAANHLHLVRGAAVHVVHHVVHHFEQT